MKKLLQQLAIGYYLVTTTQAAVNVTINNTHGCTDEIVLRYDVTCTGSGFVYGTGIYVGPGTQTYTLPSWVVNNGGCGQIVNLIINSAPVGNPAPGTTFTLCTQPGCTYSTTCAPSCLTSNLITTWTIYNNSTDVKSYQAYYGADAYCESWLQLSPNQNGTITITQPIQIGTGCHPSEADLLPMTLKSGTYTGFTAVPGCTVMNFDPNRPITTESITPDKTYGAGGGGASGGHGGPYNGPPGGTNTLTGGNPTNTVPANTNGLTGAGMEGFNMLHNDITAAAGQANSHFVTMENKLTGIDTGVGKLTNFIAGIKGGIWDTQGINGLGNSITGYLGKILSATGTNTINGLSDSNAINAFAAQNGTNLNRIAGILSSLTNGTASNGQYWVSGKMTNATDATTASGTIISTVTANIDTVTTGIGAAPSMSGGSGAGMSIEFAGSTLNLDPENIAPGAMAWLKVLITIITSLGFAYSMGKLFMQCCQIYATAQTGGVPDLEATIFGVGGNIAGAIVAAVVATAMVTLWVAVFTYFFAQITSQITGIGGMGAINSPYGITTYLLTSVFPVNLMLSLAFTRVTFQFAMGKVVIIAASASRFLIGK